MSGRALAWVSGAFRSLRGSIAMGVGLAALPILVGIFIFLILPEVIHAPSIFRWTWGLAAMLVSLLVEYPYARWALPELERRLIPRAR